ncbi:MAG: hypothetical protein WD025_01040 [Bacteriovoracaceae bacterium]
MLGPMGAFVMSVLRVMTPAEIDRHTKDSDRKRVQAAAAGAEGMDLSDAGSYPYDGQTKDSKSSFRQMTDAEIIPIQQFQEKNKSKKDRDEGERESHATSHLSHDQTQKSKNSELERVGIYSSQKMNAIKEAENEKIKAGEESTTVFLLKQREKLKKTKSKMMSGSAIKTYAQAANAEMIEPEYDIDDPDQELAQGSRGILVNKKRY